MIRIEHLFISPGHNFFGHHGGPAGEHAIVPVGEIKCVAGRGVHGDRFFDYKPDYKGQITFFAMEVFEGLRTAVGAPDTPPSAVRRNVLTSGAELNDLIGREFEVQGVRFLGMEECRPCYWMDGAIGRGAEEWLKGRGGLRAKILTNGRLRTDAISGGR